MNCKPGDLAVVVRSEAGNEGRVVTCIRVLTKQETSAFRLWQSRGPFWLVDRPLRLTGGDTGPFALDAWLRPIRDNDGTDETLTWAGLPNKQDKQVTA